MPELINAVVLMPCRECKGTGRNGTIGGWLAVCRPCEGNGHWPYERAHAVKVIAQEGGDEHGDAG